MNPWYQSTTLLHTYHQRLPHSPWLISLVWENINREPEYQCQASQPQVPVVIVRNRSCPAVSHIWSLMRLPSSSMVRILKSILSGSHKLITSHRHHTFQYHNIYIRLRVSTANYCSVPVSKRTHPIVVMKLVVKESSEKRRRRQDFPTPANINPNIQLIDGT